MSNRLKEIRLAKGLTLREVAEKVGMTYQAIGHYEHGNRKISLDTAVKLAAVLDCKVDDLKKE